MLFPASAEIVCAMASARSSASVAACSRIRIRSCPGVFRHTFAPATAAVSAASTSAVPAIGTDPATAPSNGEVTSCMRPDCAAVHCPPINSCTMTHPST